MGPCLSILLLLSCHSLSHQAVRVPASAHVLRTTYHMPHSSHQPVRVSVAPHIPHTRYYTPLKPLRRAAGWLLHPRAVRHHHVRCHQPPDVQECTHMAPRSVPVSAETQQCLQQLHEPGAASGLGGNAALGLKHVHRGSQGAAQSSTVCSTTMAVSRPLY